MNGPDTPKKSSNVGRVFGVVLLVWLAAAIVFAFSGGLVNYDNPTTATPFWQALTAGLLVAGPVAGFIVARKWR
jgi:hypothetical protein